MIILPIGDDNPRRTFPFINLALIVANVGIFAWMLLGPGVSYDGVIREWGMVPARWTLETLGTSMFLHGGLLHLLGNMLFLWIVGDNVEDRLGHLGYLFFYATAGAVAGFAHIDGNPASKIPCVGASGAISGVMAAYLVLFPRVKIRFWGLFWFIIVVRSFTFHLPAVLAIGFWFVEQFLLGTLAAETPGVTEVAYDAHIGGFLAGLVVVGAMRLFGVVKGGRQE